jgi:hypothetical protein
MKRTTFRSDPRVPRVSPFRSLLALAVIGLLHAGATGQVPAEAPAFESVFPLEPEDGATVRARPVFTIGYAGVDAGDVLELRFKLSLSQDGFASERYVYDQRARNRGWLVGTEGQILYRPQRPLRDGEYEWRVWVWDGVDWATAGRSRRLRVDTVPPADVERLEARYDVENDALTLRWAPVTLDRDGRPEYVTRYHVYRYDRDPSLPPVRLYEIGIVEIPEFVDTSPSPDGQDVLFYRVAAEDAAGNVPDRKE